MEKRPKVSVVIPIYNVENYLSRCLESVIHQTLLDIEIIGVNDGTKDNSVAILCKYMELDHRIQLVEKENGGLACQKCRTGCGDGRDGDLPGFGRLPC